MAAVEKRQRDEAGRPQRCGQQVGLEPGAPGSSATRQERCPGLPGFVSLPLLAEQFVVDLQDFAEQ
jgi:hypothetical protein